MTLRRFAPPLLAVALLLFMSAVPTISAGSPTWVAGYDGPAESEPDSGWRVTATPDGGYIFPGARRAGTGYSVQRELPWVVKLDDAGEIEWEKAYGSDYPHPARIEQVVPRPGGGYLAAGYRDPAPEVRRLWVARLDDVGKVVWQKNYGPVSKTLYYVRLTAATDGGCLVVASTVTTDGGGTGVLLTRLDQDGAARWQVTWGGMGAETVSDVIQTGDGDFLVAGSTGSFGSGRDGFLLRVSADSEFEWQRTYGGTDEDGLVSVRQLAGGGLIAGGFSASDSANGTREVWVLSLDQAGGILWQRVYERPADVFDRIPDSVRGVAGGGFVVGGVDSLPNGSGDGWLMGLTGSGEISWERHLDFMVTGLDVATGGGLVVSGRDADWRSASSPYVAALATDGTIPGCGPVEEGPHSSRPASSVATDVPGVRAILPAQGMTMIVTGRPTGAVAIHLCPYEVALLKPRRGARLGSGEDVEVSWRHPPEADHFGLEYSLDAGETWTIIDGGIPASPTGEVGYRWVVPVTRRNFPNARLRFTMYDQAGRELARIARRIAIEVVRVYEPDGKHYTERWTGLVRVNWLVNETAEPVAGTTLSFTDDGGRSWNRTAVLEGNPRLYWWKPPDSPVARRFCKVRVSLRDAAGESLGKATSGGWFTLPAR